MFLKVVVGSGVLGLGLFGGMAWGGQAAQAGRPDAAGNPVQTGQEKDGAQGAAASAHTVHYVEQELFVPVPNALPQGLDVLKVYVTTPGKHPLVVLTHGSAVGRKDHAYVTPWAQLSQAVWFARRGFVVLVVVRKGYGRSAGQEDGLYSGCRRQGSFEEAGEDSAFDLKHVIAWGRKLPEVDPEKVLSAGVSTGGFAQVALVADPPEGLKGAISFAGGRGSDGKGTDCDLGGLVSAFHAYGKGAAKHGALPMLWIYSENDHFFPQAMATQFDAAYRKGGGVEEFVMAPPDGEDGHHLYSHTEAWSDTVTAYLKERGLLPLGDALLPGPPVPDTPAPAGVAGKGLEGWKHYLMGGRYKAFAAAEDGSWGYVAGEFDQSRADERAMDHCKKAEAGKGERCAIVARTVAGK